MHLGLCKKDPVPVSNLLIAAKLLIAQKRKLEEVPFVEDWQQKCQYMWLMNKRTAIRKGNDGLGTAVDKMY